MVLVFVQPQWEETDIFPRRSPGLVTTSDSGPGVSTFQTRKNSVRQESAIGGAIVSCVRGAYIRSFLVRQTTTEAMVLWPGV